MREKFRRIDISFAVACGRQGIPEADVFRILDLASRIETMQMNQHAKPGRDWHSRIIEADTQLDALLQKHGLHQPPSGGGINYGAIVVGFRDEPLREYVLGRF